MEDVIEDFVYVTGRKITVKLKDLPEANTNAVNVAEF